MPSEATVPRDKTCLPCDGIGQILYPVYVDEYGNAMVLPIPCWDCRGRGIRKPE